MDFSLRKITKELLPAFTPYLLPQAAELILRDAPGLVAIGAVTGSQTCGAIAACAENGELSVFSLFSDEKVRRQGLASTLLDEAVKAAGCARITARWILPEDEFLEAESFFLSKGFSPAERGDDIYRLSSADFRKAPSLRAAFLPNYRPDGNIVPVSEFTDAELYELSQDSSIPSFLRLNNFTKTELSQSTALGYRYEGRITAYFICTLSGGSTVALRAALSRDGTPPAVFHLLTAAAIKQVISQLGADFFVFISPVTAPSMRLTNQLSGGRYEIWSEGCCEKLCHGLQA